jgi:hypothetical protein
VDSVDCVNERSEAESQPRARRSRDAGGKAVAFDFAFKVLLLIAWHRILLLTELARLIGSGDSL